MSALPFSAATSAWFEGALGQPTPAQSRGWPPIANGESTLILAPTGSGKTLAAFLSAIDRLAFAPRAEPKPKKRGQKTEERTRVLYVSPLKALAVDIERNLRAPLAGVLERARAMGIDARPIKVGVRTGDTPASERARMLRHPPDILITTPESLYLMLTSDARTILDAVETVIIDEIHQLVSSKRGAHLFVTLERLEEERRKAKTTRGLQRIGLSATQKPLDVVARLLGGSRKVTIVDAGERKTLVLGVRAPAIDFAHIGDIESPAAEAATQRSSIWPHLHAELVRLIAEHRTTMIFVNSRRLAERLASALNEVAQTEIALAHHGSVAREKRAEIEDRLKRGDLKSIVATSSLELGIDVGAVDLVVQIESPPSVASGLQRIGRASHHVGGVPAGIILPKHRADLLACAAAATAIREGDIEASQLTNSPLDVLAQQIVAICAVDGGDIKVEDLFALIRRAAPFADLPRTSFDGVLDMLSGRYPSEEFAELRPRLTWDRVRGVVRARPGAKRLAVINGGTIPDRGLYGVFLAGDDKRGGRRVGELDEEMVFELREGEVFLLGASSWRVDEITIDRVLVTPASGVPGKMPFWHGDRAGRSRELGLRMGKLVGDLASRADDEAFDLLATEHHMDEPAAKNLIAFVRDQKAAMQVVPTDKCIVVERFVDEIGDLRVCIHAPLGMRVVAPWAMAIMARLRALRAGEPDVVWADDGIVFRITAASEEVPGDVFFPPAAEVEGLVTDSVSHSSLFAARFRENAGRALLLPRRSPGRRTPLWAQRKRAQDLLAVASRYPSFPIVLETYRECLRDAFDLAGLVDTLRGVETRKVRVVDILSTKPSPFAASLLFSFVASFIYDGDAPLAERRAHALTIDHAQLRELLGDKELRELFDADVIESYARTLQRLDMPARDADELSDLFRILGDLDASEVAARCKGPHDEWLGTLLRERRIAKVRIAGIERFIAAEDASKYVDGLGVAIPQGLPHAFLEPTPHPLRAIIARYARTHVPFPHDDLIARYGIAPDWLRTEVSALIAEGRLVEGAFLPHPLATNSAELCHKDVLASLRSMTLARLRKEIEPVDAATYARFLCDWQGVGARHGGPDALLSAVERLEGCPLAFSALESDILPARVAGYRKGDIDALIASGLVVWAGVEPIGPNDGRVALYLADHEAIVSPPPRTDETQSETHAKIRELLTRRGAVFFVEIAKQVGGFPEDVRSALMDMVWSGEVTNDTLDPLRRLAASEPRDRPRERASIARLVARRAGTDALGGRFSLRAVRWDVTPTDTERSAALAQSLLERYGVLTREAAQAEGIAGGFGSVYDVLKRMEETGRIRRGYFVEGRGAAQFALPNAAESLRQSRDGAKLPTRRVLATSEDAIVLSAVDPANPHGALLPWPALPEGTAIQRTGGAHVVLVRGALAAWLGRGEETLVPFLPAEEPARMATATAIARALSAWARATQRRALLITTINPECPEMARALEAVGFGRSARGHLLLGTVA